MKHLFLSAACVLLGSLFAQAQNADPVVNIDADDVSVFVGNTTIVSVDAGNFGADAIAPSSLELVITAGPASEIVGTPDLSGTKWMLYSKTTGSKNKYVFRNNSAFDGDFDISSFDLTLQAQTVTASDAIEAQIKYISGPNPHLAGNPESMVQGNGATDNDLSQTSMIIKLATPLPLQLISFTGQESGCQAKLDWSAMDDVELQWYEVQQSSNGRDFETVAKLPSHRTPSTSGYTISVPLQYSGLNYYRLRMKTVSGQVHYSETLALRTTCGEPLVQVYPNPASSVLQVSGVKAGVQLSILNGSGQLVRQVKASGSLTVISLSGLPAGAYQLRIEGSDKSAFRFIKAVH